MVLMAPANEEELARMLKTALTWEGPAALRYPRGEATGVGVPQEIEPMEVGKGELVREGKDLVLLVAGHLLPEAQEAVSLLEERGISPALVNARFVKPLDKDLILQWATFTGRVVTLEENTILGGFGSAVLELLAKEGVMVPVLNLGIPDDFVTHGSIKELRRELGLDGPSLADRIQRWMAGTSRRRVISLVG